MSGGESESDISDIGQVMEALGSDQAQAHYTVTVSIDQNYLLALDNENTEACIVCGDRASGQCLLCSATCDPHIKHQDDITGPSVVRDARDSSRDPSARRLGTSVGAEATVQSTRVTVTDVSTAD